MLQYVAIHDYDEYCKFVEHNKEEIDKRLNIENSYIQQSIPYDLRFVISGYCLLCNKEVNFHVDSVFNNISLDASKSSTRINWRERLICLSCQLNNRIRGVVTMLMRLGLNDESIYVTEQTTPLYKYLTDHYSNVQGSEYLPDVSFGMLSEQGVRSEDMTKLTLESNSFDYILTLDVMEHIPDYLQAMKECHRVLKHGGRLIMTVPFLYDYEHNLTRAKLNEKGEVIYCLPPEYHGDPARGNDYLCFRYFGWDILNDLMSAGFQHSIGCLYTNLYYGHFGLQTIFVAIK